MQIFVFLGAVLNGKNHVAKSLIVHKVGSIYCSFFNTNLNQIIESQINILYVVIFFEKFHGYFPTKSSVFYGYFPTYK